MVAAQLDSNGFYVGPAEVYGGVMPYGAITTLPPERELPENYRWQYVRGEYLQTPDYRGKDVYDEKGDLYRVEEYGPLPEGHGLTPPVLIPTLKEALEIKIQAIMDGYTASFASVEAEYPLTEREGWTTQEAEAAALLSNPSADTPVLSILVATRGKGETAVELAQKVLDNATNWRVLYGYLTGQQQRMYSEVVALAAGAGITAEHVLAYEVKYIMPVGG